MAAYVGSRQFDSRYCLSTPSSVSKTLFATALARSPCEKHTVLFRARQIMAGTITITWETNQQKQQQHTGIMHLHIP